MILGTTVLRMDGNPYYSPAFPKGGDAAVFSVDVQHVLDAPTVVFTIQHRNMSDTTWTDVISFSGITTTGVFTRDATGLKELVRLKLSFTSVDPIDGIHFLIPPPAWRPD